MHRRRHHRRVAGRWSRDRGARVVADVRAGCHPYADTGRDERARAIEHEARRVRAEEQLQLAALRQAVQGREIQIAPRQRPRACQADVESEPVPYGEAPLSGARLGRLRDIAQLKAGGFRGTLEVATFVGEFCLVGNGIEGYSMAADDLPANRCDLRGNPFDDGLSVAQRQSLPFANLVASLRQDRSDALRRGRARRSQASCAVSARRPVGEVTAGDWNKIAAQNNRVEFAAQPAGCGSELVALWRNAVHEGKLIAREAVARGMRPVLAGRSRQKVEQLAAELGCQSAVFSLDDHTAMVRALDGMTAVPLRRTVLATARPMMQGCLATHVHYLDITGEIDVFELAHSVDDKRTARRSCCVPASVSTSCRPTASPPS